MTEMFCPVRGNFQAQNSFSAIFHLPAMSDTTSLREQKQHLENLLWKLNGFIKKLLTTLPCGSKEGPITKHFSDLTYNTKVGRIHL